MSNVLIEESTLKAIADSIRAKSGKTEKMLPSAMANEITNLPSGGGVGNLTKYAKFIATPDSSSAFTIQNPLGGIAKKVFVKIVEPLDSKAGTEMYIADNELSCGVSVIKDKSGYASTYGVSVATGTYYDRKFKITEGTIILGSHTSYPWSLVNEYEVEIYQ